MPIMSKEGYKMVARSIKRAQEINEETINSYDVRAALWDAANLMSKEFKEDNPNFNNDIFMAACGFWGVK